MSTPTTHQVTLLLRAWRQGDHQALHLLRPLVYDELHQPARHYTRYERPGHLLPRTALVNEAYDPVFMEFIAELKLRWEQYQREIG